MTTRNPIAREVRSPKYKPRIVKSKKLYTRKGRRIALAVLVLIGSVTAAIGHETYANGITVPAWVKQHCCGVADIHRYSIGELRHDHDGWHVPGLNQAIPDNLAEASEDEYVYAFFAEHQVAEGEYIMVWCLFIPQGSV